MCEIQEGDIYEYHHNMYENVDIEIVSALNINDENNMTHIECEIIEPEIVRKELYNAKKTLDKNGNDLKNASECFKFVQISDNELQPYPKLVFILKDYFFERCEKK